MRPDNCCVMKNRRVKDDKKHTKGQNTIYFTSAPGYAILNLKKHLFCYLGFIIRLSGAKTFIIDTPQITAGLVHWRKVNPEEKMSFVHTQPYLSMPILHLPYITLFYPASVY